ncbi:hypothetical protein TPA0598_04_08420 [Streptomyces lydicamycinicus]|uniref:DUF4352 domain-containing protein n=1 Tax=Streptomyces lydicamycinicus TaxID=1546107 RepID=A0A0P4R8N8_9ACTN|nr:hypothetical protein TPA0598_04_08420 [Streptomyces lydicamycinicus]
MRHHTAIATAAILLLVTSCASSKQSEKASPKTGGRTEAASIEPPSPTEEAASKAPTTLTIGFPWEWRNGDESSIGKTTVVSWKQPIHSVGSAAEETGEKGYVWGALDLKVCTDRGEVLSSQTDWTLAYQDGARIEPSSSTWDDFPKPEFPAETQVRAGDCVRGKLVFPIPSGQRPERVLYAPNGDGASLAEWTVPAT